jgi:hypothetical protein
MEVWQRRRQPDEVPAKVAVAVSDFCRRAKAKAPAAVVREALALIDAAEDFRVLDLCEGEPEATPLGPFAVIDLVHGTAASVAAQREATGYYALARELAGKAPPPKKDDDAPKKKPNLDTPAWKDATAKAKEAREARREKKKEKTVKERIAPKRREKKTDPNLTAVAQAPAEQPSVNVRKRDLPLGRGRFVQLSATKQKVDVLMKSDAKSELTTQIDQIGNRLGLLKALERGFEGRKGPLSLADVEKVLSRHELSDRLAKKEKESIIAAIAASKGSIGRAAFELGVSPRDLERLIEGASVGREIAEIRERYTKEALAPRNLALRLDLVAREKYLDDLKITQRFKTQLSKDLEPLLDSALPASDLEQLALSAAKMHGLDAVRLRRAMTHTGLDQAFTPRLTA